MPGSAVIGKGGEDGTVSEPEVRELISAAVGEHDLRGRRVLAIIPDHTRTAPMPMLFRALRDTLGREAAALDFLIALGTHRPMSDSRINRMLNLTAQERTSLAASTQIFNHRWDVPGTLHTIGVISLEETRFLSRGLIEEEIPVLINEQVFGYDQLLICGPVFPHEVVGFSGGNKYLFPGISSGAMIDTTHWLGALLTNLSVNGVRRTPVRDLIDQAASLLDVPVLCLALVMQRDELVGMYVGTPQAAFEEAAALSGRLNIVYLERPVERALSVASKNYEDLWTAAKAMYKVEPVIADGGEVILYAPHISRVSFTHGSIIEEVGYHTRDYFLQQWDRFRGVPRCVLAHLTHLKGTGSVDNGVERPRIRVTLATGIPREVCERINLGYADPARIDLAKWKKRQEEGTALVVERAGEILYRPTGWKG